MMNTSKGVLLKHQTCRYCDVDSRFPHAVHRQVNNQQALEGACHHCFRFIVQPSAWNRAWTRLGKVKVRPSRSF